MNTKIETIEKNVVQFEIEVDEARFEQGMQKAYRKNVSKFNVPGFRIGKAPRNIIEKYFGAESLYEDAINEVYPEAYDMAVEQHNVEPVEKPEIDVKQIGKGQNFIFTAKVTVKPEVELAQYNGVEVVKIVAKVSGEEIENEIKKIQDKNARLVTVEDRAVKMQDQTLMDFEGFVDGVAFPGGKGEAYSLEIGSGHFIPGFEEQLVGVNLEEEKEINVTFPQEYHSKDLAGKPALFKVRITEIKEKQLPEVDDEFAKDVSEFDTLEEYKADLLAKLQIKAEDDAKNQTESNIIEKIVENATVEIPSVMVDRRIDEILYEFDYSLKYQGLDIEKYIKIMGIPFSELRSQFESRAEREVRTSLVVDKISKVENIEVSNEEVEAELENVAGKYGKTVEDLKKNMNSNEVEDVKYSLKARKTVEFLVNNAKLI